MTFSALIRKPSAFLPLVMSTAALATILIYVAFAGTEPQADEGAAAHIWQLLMVCQLPIIALFAMRWFANGPRAAQMVVLLQVGAMLLALAPVMWLGF